ncbi:MAG: stage II sporulation protein E [Bacillota bacterium]|nr:stage II sporulation protein E [Bacillota bacterium]MDD3850277.1 stage II sporulation protein E [Bacillota bacterium]MDD4707855.1 stage II sporulation protein E [Bacillota bacterium]
MNKSQAFPIYTSSRDAVYIRGMVTINLIGFFMSRAFILENTMPFGTAFFSAALLNRCMPIPVFLSAALGLISTAGLAASYKHITTMGLVYIISRILFRKKPAKRHSLSLITFFTMLGTSVFWLNSAGSWIPFDMIILGFEALAGGILVYIFDYAFSVIKDLGKGRHVSREDAICTAVAIAVAVSGIGALRVWHIAIKIMVMAVVIMMGAYTGGATTGSAAGALLGLTSGLMTTRAAAMVGVFSFAGMLSGTFKELGRAGSILGFIIGSSILNFYMGGGAASLINMEELLAASLLFILIPGRVLEGLACVMDGDGETDERVPYHIKAREFASIRLKEFAGVFTQLSASFNDVSFKEDFLGRRSLNKLIDGICNRSCLNCSFRRTCWEKEIYFTYQSVFQLLCIAEEKGIAEEKDIPPSLRKRCIKPECLIEAVNYLFDLFRINYKWQLKMEDCRNLVSQQLEGMAGVMENLAGEIDMRLKFNAKLERDISKTLAEKGIEVFRAVVVEKPGRGLEVYLDRKPCFGCRECVKKVIPAVSAVTGRRFNKPDYLCSIKNGVCSLKLVEARKFNVSTGVCSAPKEEGQVNGDNYSFMELKNHQYLIALSDGMGTGARASLESSTTINMLEQLLEVGYGHDLAVRTINSIMMLKSPGDSFSTLDIALIDMYNGDVKLVKIGAPPTYIKRGDEVKVLSASSLPMGIVDKIDYHTKKLTVVEDDFIVMVTDGIAEACEEEDSEEWVADILRGTNNRNPQEIARIIFERALEYYDGQARDDMTVVVSKVWKNL